MPDAVCRLDAGGRFTYVNAAAERLLGPPRRGAAGPSAPRTASRPPWARSLERAVPETLAEGRPREFDYFYEPQARWYEIRVFPDPPGSRSSSATSTSGTAPTPAGRPSCAELTAVLEALPSATVLIDEDGRIVTDQLGVD